MDGPASKNSEDSEYSYSLQEEGEEEEEPAIPWEAISVAPITNTHDYFLAFHPFQGWFPYILRSDTRQNWDRERAFGARMLRVGKEELIMHEGDEEMARRYGCRRTLMLVFPVPTRADLAGGGKKKAKEEPRQRLKLKSRSPENWQNVQVCRKEA